MSEKNPKVAVDAVVLIVAKIKATAMQYEGKYALNKDVYKSILKVYKKFRKFALQNDGGIVSIDVCSTDKVKIVAEVPDVDLLRERLDQFTELLAMVDSIDVSASMDGYLTIEIGVAGLWKAV